MTLTKKILTALVPVFMSAAASVSFAQEQVELTEQGMKSYISVLRNLKPINDEIEKNGGRRSEKVIEQINQLVKNFGFKDHSEFDNFTHSIEIVLWKINPQTGAYVDQRALVQQEVERLQSDTSISSKAKEALITELNILKATILVPKYQGNILLVTKYRESLLK